jgi:copper homeostasis protein (lipoprotein)
VRLAPALALAAIALSLATVAAPAPAGAQEITGSVTYRDRARLPPDAVLTVALTGAAHDGAPVRVIATRRYEALGAPPWPYALGYDPAAIDESRAYAVSARVTLGDRLLLTTGAAAPVLTQGTGGAADLTLERGPASDTAEGTARRVPVAPGLTLPASFTGTLPMASGPGREWHLDLWPDQTFHLRRSGGEGATDADLGRWYADPARGAIVLPGVDSGPLFLEVRGNGDLRLMDRAGAPIQSDLPYGLAAGPLEPAEISAPMSGLFLYFADAATFTECRTGRTYPVAMEGAYLDAERAFLESEGREPGSPVLATLEGTLAPREPMEGPVRTHLVVDRLVRMDPSGDCTGARVEARLRNTYWKIVELSGMAVDPFEGRREAHLVLHAADPATFNATIGCNMMRGGYTLEGETLAFGDAAMTMMACPPPLDATERALGEALAASAGWQVTATVLELFDAEGARVLMGEAAYLP